MLTVNVATVLLLDALLAASAVREDMRILNGMSVLLNNLLIIQVLQGLLFLYCYFSFLVIMVYALCFGFFFMYFLLC